MEAVGEGLDGHQGRCVTQSQQRVHLAAKNFVGGITVLGGFGGDGKKIFYPLQRCVSPSEASLVFTTVSDVISQEHVHVASWQGGGRRIGCHHNTRHVGESCSRPSWFLYTGL